MKQKLILNSYIEHLYRFRLNMTISMIVYIYLKPIYIKVLSLEIHKSKNLKQLINFQKIYLDN